MFSFIEFFAHEKTRKESRITDFTDFSKEVKLKIWATLILFTVHCLLFTVNSFAQEVLTLENAVKIGLENNLQIKIVENQKEISENNNSFGNAGFLPKLDASISAQKNFPSTTISVGQIETKNETSTTALNGELSLNWTIFDGFGMFARKSKFLSFEKQSSENLKNTVEEISLGILQSYFNVVLQSNLLKIFEESVKISNDRFKIAKTRNDLGQISKFDLYNAEVSLNLDKSKSLQQSSNFIEAKNNLEVLLNQDFANSFKVQNEISVKKNSYKIEEVSTLALEKNSGVKVKKEVVKGLDSDVTSSKSSFYPRVSVFGKLTSTDSESFFNSQLSETKGENFTVGLTASVNLWNGNSDKIKIQNSKIVKKTAELDLMNLQNQIRKNAETLILRYENELEIIKIQEENFKASKANLDLQKKNYEVGNINSLQFRDAQNSFVNAETNLITAKFQAKITELKIQKLIGEIVLN